MLRRGSVHGHGVGARLGRTVATKLERIIAEQPERFMPHQPVSTGLITVSAIVVGGRD
jgi:hypothetical protein